MSNLRGIKLPPRDGHKARRCYRIHSDVFDHITVLQRAVDMMLRLGDLTPEGGMIILLDEYQLEEVRAAERKDEQWMELHHKSHPK